MHNASCPVLKTFMFYTPDKPDNVNGRAIEVCFYWFVSFLDVLLQRIKAMVWIRLALVVELERLLMDA